MMSPSRETTPKKRESRAGTRKVTSLSADQLERKRANDREAQRTIRQRTKEHIEGLEHQVAEMRPKAQQFDEIARRNAALEDEIRRLRHQLAMVSGRQGYSDTHSSYSSSSAPSFPPQLPGPLGLHPASGAPSALSTPSQVSLAPEWQHYSLAQSPSSLCDSTESDYPKRVEPFVLEGQLQARPPLPPQQPAPMSVPGFNAPGGGTGRLLDPTGSSSYSPYYSTSNPQHPTSHGDEEVQQQTTPQPAMAYGGSGPRSIPDPSSIPAEKGPGDYPVFQATTHQQPYSAMGRPPQGNQTQYGYSWYQQS